MISLKCSLVTKKMFGLIYWCEGFDFLSMFLRIFESPVDQIHDRTIYKQNANTCKFNTFLAVRHNHFIIQYAIFTQCTVKYDR